MVEHPQTTSPEHRRVLRLPTVVHELRGERRSRLRVRYPRNSDVSATLDALRALDGVHTARANTRARSVVVGFDPNMVTRASVLRCLGYYGSSSGSAATPEKRTGLFEDPTTTALWGAGLLVVAQPLLPVFLKRMLVMGAIAPTVLRGVRSLLTKGVSVDLLDAAAVTIPALRGKPGTAAMTNLLLRFAAYVEERASERSDDLVRSLLRTTPETVRVLEEDHETERAYAELRVGELVVVMPGEIVPVDGEAVGGEAVIDSSAITGESIPTPVSAGASVKSGVAVIEGRLVVAAERVGDTTTVARIRQFIERALRERSGFQRLADRMADRRAWVTFGAGAGVYAMTGNLARVESISLVDFSCTTKLGTAVAIKGTLYRAGRHGVLVKGGDALDALSEADTVVFDKTGTLTTGRLYVTGVVSLDAEAWPEDRILALAGSLAEHTTHPVAASVVEAVARRGLAHIGHQEVDFMVGHGLTSEVDGAEVVVGSFHFIQDHKRVTLEPVEERLRGHEAEGGTVLYVAREGKALGAILLREEPREEAHRVLANLRSLGMRRLIMLTGDRRQHAQRLAKRLQIDELHAEIEPRDKAAIVHELRAEGHRVVFVGDGVNDGPALMAANVGIAMPKAADIARATADVVLLDDRLEGVPRAIELSREMLAHLRRTLNVAAAVNTGVLLMAATGRMPALAASLLHNGTTLGVLASSWFGTERD